MDTDAPNTLSEHPQPYTASPTDALAMPSNALEVANTTQVQSELPAKRNRFCIASVAPKFSTAQARAAALRRWEVARAVETPPENQNATEGKESAASAYLTEQRDIIRARMQRISTMLDTEEDAGKLDRLASAWSKLAEQERILDGRPLPGSLKPTTAKPRDRRMEGLGPVG